MPPSPLSLLTPPFPTTPPAPHHALAVTHLCGSPDLFQIRRCESCLQPLSARSPPPPPLSLRRRCSSLLSSFWPRSPPWLKTHFAVHLLLLSSCASLDHQREPAPPPTACGSQTTSPACLCLSSLSLRHTLSLSLSTLALFLPSLHSPPPPSPLPPHLVTMETPGKSRASSRWLTRSKRFSLQLELRDLSGSVGRKEQMNGEKEGNGSRNLRLFISSFLSTHSQVDTVSRKFPPAEILPII